jgi:hypothetical protein
MRSRIKTVSPQRAYQNIDFQFSVQGAVSGQLAAADC